MVSTPKDRLVGIKQRCDLADLGHAFLKIAVLYRLLYEAWWKEF